LKKVDYIIVGQGIAGTFLSWFFLKHNKSFIVIDEKKESSASRVAAGIIHPVTGRRMVKTWMADILLPFCSSTYEEIENHFSVKLFHPLPVAELLSSAREYNDWMSRSEEAEMKSYVGNEIAQDLYSEFLHPVFKKIAINKSSWIDISSLLSTFRNLYSAKEILSEEKFEHDQLKLDDGLVEYKNIRADKIIFCEGVEALQNPWWKDLPFLPAKGEVLVIKAEMELRHVINKKIYILQIGKNIFKAGSTYSWNFQDDSPTAEAKDFLVAQLKSILKIPFEVISHHAAVRPTVKNRRPFLGLHLQYPQVGIFNGLGTKGCLLAPYFAGHLTGFLLGKNELMKEIDVTKMNWS